MVSQINCLCSCIAPHPPATPTGLKLKLEKQTALLHSFSYALFPTLERSSPVDWQYLVTEHQETQNIRVHQLQKGEKLQELLKEFQQSYAKAVLLINIEDDYTLPPEVVSSVTEVLYPVLIVTRSDGEEILKYVEKYDGEGIYARVDAENQVDEVDKVQGSAASQPLSAQKRASGDSSISECVFLSYS